MGFTGVSIEYPIVFRIQEQYSRTEASTDGSFNRRRPIDKVRIAIGTNRYQCSDSNKVVLMCRERRVGFFVANMEVVFMI
jgi:hypothetical protein